MKINNDKKEIQIPVENILLPGFLSIPPDPKGLVIFSHGSGSSRLSSRNNWVAQKLQDAGFATLLFDLLTAEEDKRRTLRFDIPLLTQRLIQVTLWCKNNYPTRDLSIVFFGASTGAASALRAAAELGNALVKAVVSRGGRPDLAGDALNKVTIPTLLIVGGKDDQVVELNEQAIKMLSGERELVIIKNATHLFPEEGALDTVADQSAKWFSKFIRNNLKLAHVQG